MKTQTLKKRFLLLIMTTCLLMSGVFELTGCSKKASRFTEEEHIQRITKRIQARYIDGDEKLRYEDTPTGFNVYPLYNENDELKYFLVEFEPFGFVYVLLHDENPTIFSWFGGRSSMYSLSDTEGQLSWSRYTIDETESQPFPETDMMWEVDENDEKIIYKKSPYAIAGIEDERRYLIHTEYYDSSRKVYIPAIKKNDKYLNLVSMDDLEIIEGRLTKKQSIVAISFIAKKHFDL